MASDQGKKNIDLVSVMASNQFKQNFELISSQIRQNIEMAKRMTNTFFKTTGTFSKEANTAFENTWKEMMASAERLKNSF